MTKTMDITWTILVKINFVTSIRDNYSPKTCFERNLPLDCDNKAQSERLAYIFTLVAEAARYAQRRESS